eukprot:CAMPEP_0202697428 /NCGR_PEP_ID=MMETSP1385-20130828/10760_1 /ASSEMBLY_ACC=CAM_ASM_000861 /TAXON_ID=933848 /ORGANISM="Elphidium margaritaceum" /LENGTH=820 /DNA_ID=CAMNT_0049353889 /DNA_START=55 /DNA_END=2514 /DNA_ORIENTATION=-
MTETDLYSTEELKQEIKSLQAINIAQREEVLAQSEQIQALARDLSSYQSIMDGAVDEVLDEVVVEDEKSSQEELDKKLKSIEAKIRSHQDCDDELLQMLYSGEIDVLDSEGPIKRMFKLCCSYARSTVVKNCIDLGIKVDADALARVRGARKPELIELLLLSRMPMSAGDRVMADCDNLNHEAAVLLFLCGELNLDAEQNRDLRATLVDAILNLIRKRRPISSLLIRLALKLDTAHVWRVLFAEIKQIIHDTSDVFGWCWLKKYILNQTFLFEKYAVPSDFSADHAGDADDAEEKGADASQRMLKDLNHKEFIAFLGKCVDLYHETDKAKDGYRLNIRDDNIPKMYRALETLHVDGNKFLNMDHDEFFGILEAEEVLNGNEFAAFLKKDTPISLKHDFRSSFVPFEVPFILEETYVLSEVMRESEMVSANEAVKDITAFYDEWVQSAFEWQFILHYGKALWMDGVAQKLRQSLPCKLSRQELVRKHIQLKFYDFSIYLNELFLECRQVNDAFQDDVKNMFADVAGDLNMKFQPGPLKLPDRCVMKCETDYYDEPFPTAACLLDIVRCTLIFDDLAGLVDGIKRFEAEIESAKYCVKRILRVKNGFHESFGTADAIRFEYADLKFNCGVVRSNGSTEIIAEVQFLLKNMSEFKPKSHKLYSVFRQRDYFENLKMIASLRKDWKSRFAWACSSQDSAKMTQLILEKGIATLDEISEVGDRVDEIAVGGNAEKGLKCLKVLCKLTKEKTFLALMKMKFGGQRGGSSSTILQSTVMKCNLYAVKWLMSALQNDDERKEVARMDNSRAIKRVMFPRELKEYMSQW